MSASSSFTVRGCSVFLRIVVSIPNIIYCCHAIILINKKTMRNPNRLKPLKPHCFVPRAPHPPPSTLYAARLKHTEEGNLVLYTLLLLHRTQPQCCITRIWESACAFARTWENQQQQKHPQGEIEK